MTDVSTLGIRLGLGIEIVRKIIKSLAALSVGIYGLLSTLLH